MTNTVTIEQVEQLAVQLPAVEQLELLARISTQLSNRGVVALPVNAGLERQQREAWAEAFLQECDAVAASIDGEFDAVADIRECREERLERL